MKILFIITVIKSRGEAYLALKAAQDIVKNGGQVLFLGMPEVMEYVERHGFKTRHLAIRKDDNRKMLTALAAEFAPDGVVYASYRNIHLGIGIGKIFDPQWIVDLKIPHASFDPENYPRDQRQISTGPLIDRTYSLPRFPESMPVISTDFIEGARAPERTFFFKPQYTAHEKQKCRAALGWNDDAPVIVFPLSRWIYDNTVYFGSSYFTEFLPNLLLHYFTRLKKPVTVCAIGHKNIFAHEKWGDINVVHEPGMTMTEYEQHIAGADLLLTDNGMSGSIEIATSQQTPVLVLKSSITASLSHGQLQSDGTFTLSPYVTEVLERMLQEKSRSVFPFAVYPLGWWEVIEHLFQNNPLYRTFCEAELFDEQSVCGLLQQLLWDTAFREKIMGLQKAYTVKQQALHSFSEVCGLIFT